MELRRELVLTIGPLVVLNLVLAFGAIGLLARMAPAVERILQENVYSIEAAEVILAELAEAESRVLPPEVQERIRQALDDAKLNVTEPEEQQVIADLADELEKANAGTSGSRQRLVNGLRFLIQINRDAMRSAGERAERLGRAGAWAAVLIGFVSFLLSLIVLSRFDKRFLRPLVDLFEVLESAKQGNRLRRCRPSQAPSEVVQVTQLVNHLLDERLRAANTDKRI